MNTLGKIIKKVIFGIIICFACFSVHISPVFAEPVLVAESLIDENEREYRKNLNEQQQDVQNNQNNQAQNNNGQNSNCVDTIILDGVCSATDILVLVVDIMSIGIGILGVIGIVWAGTLYLTAGGDPNKVQKAKTRLFEIVIGLAVYVVIYALLRFLLPGFNGIQ